MNSIYFGTFVFLFSLFVTLQTTLLQDFPIHLGMGITMASLLLTMKCNSSLLRNTLLVLFFAFLGMTNGLRIGPSAAEQLEPHFGKEVILEGYVDPLSIKIRSNYTSFLLECERLQQGSQTINYNGKVRLTLTERPAKDVPTSELDPNNSSALQANPQNLQGKIILSGKLEKLAAFHNPGGFDSVLYNRINNIGARLRNSKLIKQENSSDDNGDFQSIWRGFQNRLASYNLSLRNQLQRAMGEKSGQLLGSMLLGGSNAVDEETREIFTANGLSHLLSVSGTHLVLLASLLSLLLKPLPQPWRKLGLSFLLILYAFLCGLRSPVLRALLMSLVVLLARQADEESTPLSAREQRLARVHNNQVDRGLLLCLVAIVLLLWKPLWLLDIGFQLSFGAAAGLLWLLPVCQRTMSKLLPEFLAESLGITLAAQLGTIPILISNFHQIAVISLVSNLLLVPVLEIAALLAIVGTLVGYIPLDAVSGLGMLLAQIADFCIRQLLIQAEFFSKLPYSQLVIGSLPLWCAVLFYALLLLWADVPLLQFLANRERSAFMLCISVVLGSVILWQQYVPQPLTVYFLDVAQGDCVALLTPSRAVYVYDTGGLQGLDTGKRILAPFLRSLGKRSVEGLILSHYDYDHVGGAVGLLQQLKVREIVLPKERLDENSLALHEAITLAAQRKGSKITLAEQGRSWELGLDTIMSVLSPQAWASAGNDASTILALRSPWGSMLLTGDLSSEGEENLEIENFTLFKAGHHGSRYSNSQEFLQRLQPKITVISCGSSNRYGHPHQETLERLQGIGSEVWRTDLQGCIKVVFDENGPKCYSYIYEGF